MNPKLPNYRAWHIDENDFPKDGDIAAQIKFLLGYAILAPSMHNTQPWIYSVEEDTLRVEPDFSRSLKVGDPSGYGLYIAIGAFVENMLNAARAFGLTGEPVWLEDGVEIQFKRDSKKTTVDHQALQNIKQRQSDKLPYKADQPIAVEVIKELEGLSTPAVEVIVVSDSPRRSEIISNHISAATNVAKDTAFVDELTVWLRNNTTKAVDGMPGFVIGNSKVKSAVGKKLLKKKPQLLQKSIAVDKVLLQSAPIFIVIAAKKPLNPSKVYEVGRLMERIWLKLNEHGIAAHPMYASIQDDKALSRLATILGTEKVPTFFMRAGYAQHKMPLHTPRAAVHSGIQNSLATLTATLDSRPQSHRMQVGKYDLHYVVAGSGKPVLLIHGANIGWAQWHLNIDELAKNFKVYAIDLPGAGGSSKVTFRKTDFEKDYLEIVDQFIQKLGLKKLDIIGSSFGGWIALRLAIARKPYIRRLVLTNPIGFTRHMPLKFRPVSVPPLALLMSKTALKPTRNNKNLEKFMRDVFYEKNMPLSPEFVDYFYELSKQSHNVLFISRLAHFTGMRKELYVASDLEKIAVPTLVIWGKKDPLMPYASVKNNIPHIKDLDLRVLENVGHMPPVEAATEFNSLVIDFLKSS